jgi:malonate-semialdehyde dehydrogenase (acetylating)/methylmalonate-semialdehyde dehydrogenase
MAEAVASRGESAADWAATNPQKRARVLMKFVDLLHRDMDKLAEALSREHGKTIPDAKGDVSAGWKWRSSASARRIC